MTDLSVWFSLEHEKNDYIPTAVFKVLESDSGIGNELQFSDPLWPEQWELVSTAFPLYSLLFFSATVTRRPSHTHAFASLL